MDVIINLQPLLSPLTGIGHYTRELTLALLSRSEDSGQSFRLKGLTGSGIENLTLDHPLLAFPTGIKGTGKGQRLEGGRLWQTARRYLRNPATRRFYRWTYERHLRRVTLESDTIYWEPNYALLPWGGPSVVSVYDMSHLRYPEHHPPERVAFLNRSLGESLRRASRINVISRFTACELQELEGVEPSRIDIVPPAVSSRFFIRPSQAYSARIRDQYCLPERYLLSVGTLEPRKNLHRVLEAFASLPQTERLETPLLLVGNSGWGDYHPSATVKRALNEGSIRRLGYVPSDDLPGLYALSIGQVYVSLYEGFGMPVIEAMAAGTPVLTSNKTATSEVAGGAAIEVDPEHVDAIRQGLKQMMFEDQSERIKLGLKRAAEFSWESSANCLSRSICMARDST